MNKRMMDDRWRMADNHFRDLKLADLNVLRKKHGAPAS
jgi:hypothetical protein